MFGVAFHRAPHRGVFGRLIQAYEFLRGENHEFSHCEIIFETLATGVRRGSGRLTEIVPGDLPIDTTFSSDERDGGTRFKQWKLDPKEWCFIKIPASENDIKIARNIAEHLDHMPYDALGVLGMTFIWTALGKLGVPEHNAKQRFCSEVCAEILQSTFGWPEGEPWRISPGRLYDILVEKWYGRKKV